MRQQQVLNVERHLLQVATVLPPCHLETNGLQSHLEIIGNYIAFAAIGLLLL